MGGKDFSVLYAGDLKRRVGSDNLLPSWNRHGAGVRYKMDNGDVKVSLQQGDPDVEGPLAYEAVYNGQSNTLRGSPQYRLRAQRAGGVPAYDANVKVSGPKGINGGLDLSFNDGEPSLSGYTEFGTKRTIAKGLDVSADAKVTATPTNNELAEMLSVEPINLRASANLETLLPSIAASGSEV